MDLTIDKISEILSEAFDGGYVGNTLNEVLAEIIEKYKIDEKNDVIVDTNEFRIFTCEELQSLPIGTVFHHSILGKCRINKKFGNSYMKFDDESLMPAGFNTDSYPWDMSMKIIQE